MSAFLRIVSLGKYLTKALSTNDVRLNSSITAWALACFSRSGLRNRVTRCLSLLVVILHIMHLVVVLVNDQFKVLHLFDVYFIYGSNIDLSQM